MTGAATRGAKPVAKKKGIDWSLRELRREDGDALLAFARDIPLHDLMFLERDIRNPKVVDAWLDQCERGLIRSTLAFSGDRVVGSSALVRDELSWSPHVGEIRILIAPDARGSGLGRALAQDSMDIAQQTGIERLIVRMTPDQTSALSLFEDMGFRPEALLRNQVRDARGVTNDIVILALDVNRLRSAHEVYGLPDNFPGD
ncbi:GNAT family N-acetyltransferase [Croceicoccus sp. YJ47]|uniref:GNAT family N-acetyltransferase n=1 Tax=Croceicoccus sp. YJ47 TaxID=2798724 RepID=UPI001921890F|nr:GNAT family N-acetyltransferase [Croceicoccus sp. YJ47]QQN73408.1 GNAT family N-acetyltransferase [Croceicoccus sp. YJ47]